MVKRLKTTDRGQAQAVILEPAPDTGSAGPAVRAKAADDVPPPTSQVPSRASAEVVPVEVAPAYQDARFDPDSRARGAFENWLEVLCDSLPGVHSAALLSPRRDQDPELLAGWPRDLLRHEDLSAVVNYALKKRGQVCLARAHVIDGKALDYFAKPVFMRSRLVGVLAIKMKHLPAKRHIIVFHTLKLAIKWLRFVAQDQSQAETFYNHVVGILASCFDQDGYRQGLMRLARELETKFDCERVAIAECDGGTCRIAIFSDAATVEPRSSVARKIVDVMREAIEQDAAILYPDPGDRLVRRAHRELARLCGVGAVATLPLIDRQRIIGAVTLLARDENALNRQTVDLCQQCLSLLGPFLALKREQGRPFGERLRARICGALGTVLGGGSDRGV